jgi:hypothetical protein
MEKVSEEGSECVIGGRETEFGVRREGKSGGGALCTLKMERVGSFSHREDRHVAISERKRVVRWFCSTSLPA